MIKFKKNKYSRIISCLLVFFFLSQQACFAVSPAAGPNNTVKILNFLSSISLVPISFWLMSPILNTFKYISYTYLLPKINEILIAKSGIKGDNALITKAFLSTSAISALDYSRSASASGSPDKDSSLIFSGAYIDGITAAMMMWSKLSARRQVEKKKVLDSKTREPQKNTFENLYNYFNKKIILPLRVRMQRLFKVYLGYDPQKGPMVQRPGECLPKITDDPSLKVKVEIITKNKKNEAERIIKEDVSLKELKKIIEYKSAEKNKTVLIITDNQGREISDSQALSRLEKNEGGLISLDTGEQVTVREAAKIQEQNAKCGKGKFVKEWDSKKQKWIYRPFNEALLGQLRSGYSILNEETIGQKGSAYRRSRVSKQYYDTTDVNEPKQGLNFLKILFVHYLINSMNIVSMGRVRAIPVIKNNQVDFVYTWTRGNDISFLGRQNDYIEEVQKKGLSASLGELISGCPSATLNFLNLGNTINKGLFTDKAGNYLRDLNKNNSEMFKVMEQFLAKRQDFMNIVAQEIDAVSQRMIAEANRGNQKVTKATSNIKYIQGKIKELSRRDFLTSQEKISLENLNRYYRDYQSLEKNLSWLKNVKESKEKAMDKQVELTLLEGLMDFVSSINPSGVSVADKNAPAKKDALVGDLEDWQENISSLKPLLSGSPQDQEELDQTLANLNQGLERYKKQMERAIKTLSTDAVKQASLVTKDKVSAQEGPDKNTLRNLRSEDKKSKPDLKDAADKSEKSYVAVDSQELQGQHYYKENIAEGGLEVGNYSKASIEEDSKKINTTQELKKISSRAANMTDEVEYTLNQLEKFRTPDSRSYGDGSEVQRSKIWTEEEYRKFLDSLKTIQVEANSSKAN